LENVAKGDKPEGYGLGLQKKECAQKKTFSGKTVLHGLRRLDHRSIGGDTQNVDRFMRA
jgi:hypothetical protein